MRNLVLISHLEAIKTYFHAFKGYIDDRYSNDYNRFAGVDNQSFIGRKTILEFIFYLVLILFFTKIAGDISVHITSAMDIVGSVTFNLDSQLRILGTTNHPASIATRKNINFLPINKPNDISSPVPKKLSITANIITTRTSSTTAAPRMVLPSREFSLFISFRTCTVILTEVALRRTPIKGNTPYLNQTIHQHQSLQGKVKEYREPQLQRQISSFSLIVLGLFLDLL